MEELQIVYVPIADIKEYGNNPRDNAKAVDAVARSIRRFGIRTPAILDRNNTIIAGHTRIMAAIKLGISEFPCVIADDLDDAEAKALRLADNRDQEESEWDAEALADEFKALKNNGFDLLETGFDEFEIEGFMYTPEIPNWEPEDTEPDDDGTGEEEYTPREGTGSADYPKEYPGPTPEDTGHTGGFSVGGHGEERFACIFCCQSDEDREALKELIGETGELQTRYTVEKIREMLEGREADEQDAGV